MNHWKPEYGLACPMGATWNEALQGFNFAVYSKNADHISIQFFKKDTPQQPVFSFTFDAIKNKTGHVWHCFIGEAQLNGADSYAYRVNGPAEPGNFFDVQKLLLDPWGKAICFPPSFSRSAAIQPGDNTGKAPLTLLIKKDSNPDLFENDPRPYHYHDLVIYEMHVRGFTQHESSQVAVEKRGTYKGIIEKIPYLVDLGVTAVELMPVHQFDPQEGNYWGYMTLNFFSPNHRYGSVSDSWELVKEFKNMVLALHENGIEVILDVIFNHTTEGDRFGPVYSYKGIDNASYYLLQPGLNNYVDDAGTGNVMRTSYRWVRKLVLDSLRYWATEMHIDGFRFDLASIFTRNDDATINLINPAILEEISMDPVLSKVRLIAEPWDLKAYQLGNRFPGASWAQWNGAYRDDIRRFIKGDENMVAVMMTRLYGSADLFPETRPTNCKPWQSVNFINSHDGFTLYDTVAYNQKHNQANGHNNSDGPDDNYSWNCGWEGDQNVPAEIMTLRKRQAKNAITLLMFSNGIPMFRMGDEFLQTQKGNNNPYNQDNDFSWLNWERLDQFPDNYRFFKMIIAIRKSHPSLCRGNYWREDVKWSGVNGTPDLSYFSRTLAFLLKGTSVNDDDFYVMINCYWQPLEFSIQLPEMASWRCIIDTSLPSPADITEFQNGRPVNATYSVKERSVVVLQKKRV
ncbi:MULTISPECIES: glycogen debranching protein [Niastella]|uniref:Glycogen-debranching protein n=1 Tax=Niastella soli TaxID=2821487 RepID=A0ABS3YW38_9BACT|nr:isoamylase [Niastella soli]MBO9202130.1 glycogen-debranching protein [Niastella soli]